MIPVHPSGDDTAIAADPLPKVRPTTLPVHLHQALCQLMPFHLFVDQDGVVCDHGPSIAKLLGQSDLRQLHVQHLLRFEREKGRSLADIAQTADGKACRLRLVQQPNIALRGIIAALAAPDQAAADAGWLLNLSCGPAMPDLLRQGTLTAADFAPTDMAVEMLYLTEAKSAAIAASMRLNRRLQGAKTEAEMLASTDMLTGLQNRRVMDETLARFCQTGTAFSLIHLDLDYFKRVNDSLGHAAGDFVLQEVANIIRRELRSEDTIIRYGGDEFVLILRNAVRRNELSGIANRLIVEITKPMRYLGHVCQVSASLGIARAIAGQKVNPAQILHDADTALYAAKHAGRGCFRFFQARVPTTSNSKDRNTL
ncbi:GGDEF domain-containing protein [Thalassovita mediterranea]|jgi:diguanylate cyclase (GGDEF)-like protein|uniref:Stalked cell differentiation-controlling protein n=1 Tax=Thalassovita mediterranea TaxID=340021 RepID=A0A0P1H1B9_9RHOB|nr:GGDEF domain-containing protein [Thalassovita mediterranea]CUH83932.1 Stalked cell differentiation-controlling protein [Thalassovita mediterranea]SIS28086.1 diguanylate cyclase (GGDEF) domain-containing protein [Thalassovita mediterranea]